MNEKFRDLTDEETRLLLMRHGAHSANVLTPNGVAKAMATGLALEKSGIKINVAVSSPSPRALATNLNVQLGYGKMCYIHTDSRLSDMVLEHSFCLDNLKERVEARGLKWSEPGIAEVFYDPNESFMDIAEKRASDGASVLHDIAIAYLNIGKTVLVTSHGVARIEVAIQSLKGENVHQPERLAEECQIIELIFSSGHLIEENWLPTV